MIEKRIASPQVNVSLIYGDYYFTEALIRYADAYGRTNITYIPNPGFTGTDTFTCQVCDSGGNCAVTTVTVEVLNTSPTLTFNAQASLSPITGNTVVSFPAVSNYLHEVDYVDSLAQPLQWNVLSLGLAGSGSVISITDTNTARQRFYRVTAQQVQ